MEELKCAAFSLAVLGMAETMRADLNGAVVLDRIHLETSWNEHPADLRRLAQHLAEILHGLGVVLEALVVLIELEVRGEECLQRRKVAGIESGEQLTQTRTGRRQRGGLGLPIAAEEENQLRRQALHTNLWS